MKTKLTALIAGGCLLLSLAAATAAETSSVQDDLKGLVTKIKAKLQEGKTTEAELAPELKEFDTLLAKHKDEKTDEVAQILFMKAQLYLEVLDNTEKGVALVKQLKTDFPQTQLGKNAD